MKERKKEENEISHEIIKSHFSNCNSKCLLNQLIEKNAGGDEYNKFLTKVPMELYYFSL